MNLSFFIAKRYFSTKQNKSFVHIISWVSLFGVTIGAAALILVLSVFNGFEGLILNMYNSFDPDIKISLKEGKTFSPDSININHSEILESAYVLEEKVLLKYQEKEFIAMIKGVSPSYKELTKFDSLFLLNPGVYIDEQSFSDFDSLDFNYLKKTQYPLYEGSNIALVGSGVAYYLSMSIGSYPFSLLEIFLPDRDAKTLLHANKSFKKAVISPLGIFSVRPEIDEQYIITPLRFIQQLSERGNEISSIEIKIKDPDEVLKIQKELKLKIGDQFEVKNKLEQQELLYKILNTEKLAVFLILIFIMIIATFNIIGSLTMLMLDKRKDIQTLKSFGVEQQLIHYIFFKKGMLTIMLGLFLGVFIGLGIAFLQKNFGLISMGGNFLADSYPVIIKLTDVFIVGAVVVLIGLLSTWYPSKILSKKLF